MKFTFSGTAGEFRDLTKTLSGGRNTTGDVGEQIARLASGRADLAAAVAVDAPGLTPFTAGADNMNPLEDLKQEVAADVTVMGSAAKLIRGFGARLDAGIAAARAGDFASLDQLRGDLHTNADVLAAAVAENTPAESTSPEPPAGPGAGVPHSRR